ncbi:MAG: transposase [Holophagales bacterium]|nr:transposase [Holophagales bacterium]
MGREPRWVPPHSLQHVTDVTFQNRFLLRPSAELNELFLGVLGKAQREHEMTVHAAVVLSSHYHLLLRPKDARHMADFMGFLKTNISKEIGTRLHGWESSFFDDRYHNVTVSDEEEAQVRVLYYLLAQGTKEGLVDKVLDWPGAHCAEGLIDGMPLEGRWIDRTAERKARRRKGGEELSEELFASVETVVFSPLPCWQHLEEPVWRQSVAELVEVIDREAAAERRRTGRPSLGVEAVMAVDPTSRPGKVEKTPKKRFHAASQEALHQLREIWSAMLAIYREASARLRAGDRKVEFPEGTFPPALPFVPFRTVPGTELARGQPS